MEKKRKPGLRRNRNTAAKQVNVPSSIKLNFLSTIKTMPKIGVTQVKSHKRLCPEFMVSLFETGFWFSRDQGFLGANRPLDYFVSP